ncbi:12787_t:CDS:2 [Funneliformis geosporum]|uniref:11477_t:CDS:1 n=1 Tax=Funneliformis geosporum TaxID=1117311 RepID=A0A9W4SZD3_9GLOM|nr:11477_t:CDS:2 [Funneliformis geosporum]CAI2186396.1 12787_t:CDS:2 [Funneliformis geosporum]
MISHISYHIGPFCPLEDQFFYKATEWKINGNAEEVMNHFNVAWIDKGNPSKEIVEERDTRHKITDIIGSKDGLGIECLKGSGLIAGEHIRTFSQ